MYTLTVWIMHHPSRLHGYCGIYQIFNDDNDDSLAIFFSSSSKTYDVVHIIPEVTIRMRCLTRKNCGRKKNCELAQDASSLSVMMANVSHIGFYPAAKLWMRLKLSKRRTYSGVLGFIKPATSARTQTIKRIILLQNLKFSL